MFNFSDSLLASWECEWRPLWLHDPHKEMTAPLEENNIPHHIYFTPEHKLVWMTVMAWKSKYAILFCLKRWAGCVNVLWFAVTIRSVCALLLRLQMFILRSRCNVSDNFSPSNGEHTLLELKISKSKWYKTWFKAWLASSIRQEWSYGEPGRWSIAWDI